MSLPHGSVDRNWRKRATPPRPRASLPHGSVDRNTDIVMAWTDAASRSLTGAWIETLRSSSRRSRAASLPHGSVDRNCVNRCWLPLVAVAPSRERGSKHRQSAVLGRLRRRSLTGAWIETPSNSTSTPSLNRSLPHGSVDRNSEIADAAFDETLSLPHGSVDRNLSDVTERRGLDCRSLTGAWIETRPPRIALRR